jgi:MarR family transcriptional regulator, lower aerobic nicotinate degradation pathway regulator
MDVSTIKGVVDRLRGRKLVAVKTDPTDKRCSLIALSEEAKALKDTFHAVGYQITEETLGTLSRNGRKTFLKLLAKLT